MEKVDNIKMDLTETSCEGMDEIHLAQDRDKWRALLNTIIKIQISKNAGNSLTSSVSVISTEGLSFT
jgi:hypothetical protein